MYLNPEFWLLDISTGCSIGISNLTKANILHPMSPAKATAPQSFSCQ